MHFTNQSEDKMTNEPNIIERDPVTFTTAASLQSITNNAAKIQAQYRSFLLRPSNEKQPPQFSPLQVATLLGKSVSGIRRLEKEGIVDPARDERGHRVYSLQDIAVLRDYFGASPRRPKGSEAVIAGIMNQKGGSAKTTTALHLAHAAALKGYRVLLVDLDMQASATVMFGFNPDAQIEEENTVAPIVEGKEPPSALRDKILQTHIHGCDLVPSSLAVANADLEMTAGAGRQSEQWPHRLSLALRSVSSDYDLIIMDVPPHISVLTMMAACAANCLIVPTGANQYDYSSTLRFFEYLDYLANGEGTSLPLRYYWSRVLVTKYRASKTAAKMHQIIEKSFLGIVLDTVVHQAAAVSNAENMLQSAFEASRWVDAVTASTDAVSNFHSLFEELEPLFREIYAKTARKPLPALEDA